MKALTEMNNRELFCLLAGDDNIVQQAKLKEIILAYRQNTRKKSESSGKWTSVPS